MQPDTLGILTHTDGLIERRLVFLDSRTTDIDEIQWTVLIQIVSRRCSRPDTSIRNNAVRERDTFGFHMMAFESFAYVIRRALQVSIVVVEDAAPIPIEYLTDQIAANEA